MFSYPTINILQFIFAYGPIDVDNYVVVVAPIIEFKRLLLHNIVYNTILVIPDVVTSLPIFVGG